MKVIEKNETNYKSYSKIIKNSLRPNALLYNVFKDASIIYLYFLHFFKTKTIVMA
jgi:hypothetical protein